MFSLPTLRDQYEPIEMGPPTIFPTVNRLLRRLSVRLFYATPLNRLHSRYCRTRPLNLL